MKGLKNIFIEGTAKAPQVDFNGLTGELILSGRSIPENAAKLYEPLFDWVNEYISSPAEVTNFRLNLVYFNTASTIWISKIIRVLSRINKPESVLFIHLYIDIDDSESIDEDEVRDIIGSLTDNINETSMSFGVKIHAVDETGKVVRESLVFI